tara:strand:- start:6823 stop:7278 length:456 start_codon:yes stop_codon:yes gene_type:complete
LAKKKRKIEVKKRVSLKPFKDAKELDLILYWTTLLVLIMANFFMAIVIIPFLLFASNYHFYLIIGILGVFFGYVFNLLISNIENLDAHHHLMAILFIPAFTFINLIIISTSIGGLASALGIETNKEPLIISIFYVASFLTPYILSTVRKKL